MPVTEIGESERKAVWEKENEPRFRDGEFGKSVGSLDREVSKMCHTGSLGSLFQVGMFLGERK